MEAQNLALVSKRAFRNRFFKLDGLCAAHSSTILNFPLSSSTKNEP